MPYVARDENGHIAEVAETPSERAGEHVDDETILRAANLAGVTDFLRGHPMTKPLPMAPGATEAVQLPVTLP